MKASARRKLEGNGELDHGNDLLLLRLIWVPLYPKTRRRGPLRCEPRACRDSGAWTTPRRPAGRAARAL
ncbi:unnamed protein product [Urochloa humidicola]